MSDISDPGRAGRGDRKRAQNLIDAAYAAGRLTAADRGRRTERVQAAHTKGDLAAIVRDLSRADPPADTRTASAAIPGTPPVQASLGSAIPKAQFDAMLKGGSARTVRLGDAMRTSIGSSEGVRRIRRVVLIVVIGLVLLCGLGIAGVIGFVVTGVNGAFESSTEPPASSLNLQTAEGWTEWVSAVEEETGTSRVYDAVVYPEYAAVNAMVDEGAMRYLYRNGAFEMSTSPVTAATTEPVDLARIDPEMVEGLPDQTAELQDMPGYETVYMIVNQWSGEPSIMVYLQQTGKLARWSIYDFDGTVVGGTPS